MKKFLFLIICSVVSFSATAERRQPMGCEFLYTEGMYVEEFKNNIRRNIPSSHAYFEYVKKNYMKNAIENSPRKYDGFCEKAVEKFNEVYKNPKFKDNLQKSLIVQNKLLKVKQEIDQLKKNVNWPIVSFDLKLRKEKEILENKYKNVSKELDAIPEVLEYPEFQNMIKYLKESRKKIEKREYEYYKKNIDSFSNIYEFEGCPFLYTRFLQDEYFEDVTNSLDYDNIKLTKLSDKNRKDYLSDKICKKAFEMFEALYENKKFIETLKDDKEFYCYKEYGGIKHNLASYKEYQNFVKYLKDTSKTMKEKYPKWFNFVPDKYISGYDEEYVDYGKHGANGENEILKSITLFD